MALLFLVLDDVAKVGASSAGINLLTLGLVCHFAHSPTFSSGGFGGCLLLRILRLHLVINI